MSPQRRLMSVDIERIRLLRLTAVARHARGRGSPARAHPQTRDSTTARGFDRRPVAAFRRDLAGQLGERCRKKNV